MRLSTWTADFLTLFLFLTSSGAAVASEAVAQILEYSELHRVALASTVLALAALVTLVWVV